MILRVLRRLVVQPYCLRRRACSEPLRFILLDALKRYDWMDISMKRNAGEIFFICVSVIALVAALLAMRAWEVNDGITGNFMSALGKFFSVLPVPQDADIPSMRADGILVLTEKRLILVANSVAVALGIITILGALLARRKYGPSAYYAAAVLTSFCACLVVHKGIAIAMAAAGIFLVVALDMFAGSASGKSCAADTPPRESR